MSCATSKTIHAHDDDDDGDIDSCCRIRSHIISSHHILPLLFFIIYSIQYSVIVSCFIFASHAQSFPCRNASFFLFTIPSTSLHLSSLDFPSSSFAVFFFINPLFDSYTILHSFIFLSSSILSSHLLLLSTSSSSFLSRTRLSLFLSFWGILVLMPIYMTSNVITKEWDRYTLSNVVSGNLRIRIPPFLSLCLSMSSHTTLTTLILSLPYFLHATLLPAFFLCSFIPSLFHCKATKRVSTGYGQQQCSGTYSQLTSCSSSTRSTTTSQSGACSILCRHVTYCAVLYVCMYLPYC